MFLSLKKNQNKKQINVHVFYSSVGLSTAASK